MSPHCVSQGCCHFCSPIVRIHQRIHSFRSHCLVDCPRLRSSLSLSLSLSLTPPPFLLLSRLLFHPHPPRLIGSGIMLHVNDARTRERRRGERPTRNKLRRACNLYFFPFSLLFSCAPILGSLPIPGFFGFPLFFLPRTDALYGLAIEEELACSDIYYFERGVHKSRGG